MSQFLKVPPATGVIILASSLFFSEKALAQAFFLSFEEGTSALCAEEGSVTSTVHCMLGGSQGNSGAEGWAIGVTAPGHRIVDLTVAGTAAERALATGFVLNELTSGEGNDGAVSFVALSFGENSALPPNTLNRILALKVEASPGDLIDLEFVDGLQSSAGTVSNIVHVGARGFVPARRSGSFRLVKGPHFGFSMKNVDSSSLYEEIVGGKAASGVV